MSKIDNIAILLGICGNKVRDSIIYYRRSRTNKNLVAEIRKKEKIRVLFLINELAKWKTEILYQAMLKHDRFEPEICVTLSNSTHHTIQTQLEHYKQLIGYLDEKGYKYKIAKDLSNIDCDIIFYQEPYVSSYPEGFSPIYHHKLICYTSYGFTIDKAEEVANTLITNLASFFFVEDDLVKRCYSKIMRNKGKNMRITGIPFSDSLLLGKEYYKDPWRKLQKKKKRIIYAPHFSIMDNATLPFSKFLEMHDVMLEMAHKYVDTVQFAFKPHPLLEGNLQKLWGNERTESYYTLWRTMPNTQVVDGEYIGLFKYSDALIHDCGSFTTEYMYMDKPVLNSIDEKVAQDTMGEFGLIAYNASSHGSSKDVVERFIHDVISGNDPMRDVRKRNLQDHFLPPGGRTACENIMAEILGES